MRLRSQAKLGAALGFLIGISAALPAHATTVLTGSNCSTTGVLTTGTMASQFIIGCAAAGSLSIDASATGNGITTVNGTYAAGSVGGSIGNPGPGGVGTVTITGNGTAGSASLNMTRSLQVGFGGGDGTLNVNAGGLVQTTTDTYGITIANTNSTGEVTVDGAGSKLSSAGSLYVAVASGASASLTISGGGTALTTSTTLGNTGLGVGNGSVTVTGSGSSLTTGGMFFGAGNVGETSSLSVEDGATATTNQVSSGVGGGLSVGADLGATVTVTGAGSTLNVGAVTSGFLAGNELNVGGFSTGTLIVDDSGELDATGAGINISGGAFHTAFTSAGLMTVKNGGTVTANSITVWENGTLDGAGGTVNADVTVNGGTLAPGNSPGTMTITGDLNLTDGFLDLEIDPLGVSDLIIVEGNLTIGEGFLFNLDFLNPPAGGSTFNILSFFDVFGSIDIDPLFDLSESYTVTGTSPTAINVVLEEVPGTEVPEPATIALFGVGLAGFAAMRRRRQAKA